MIICTNGFGIYKDKNTVELIRLYARTSGIIVLTDSDSAGFQIRNHLKGIVPQGKIINLYIPEVFGKERRKTTPSKEGKLGVEGMDPEILLRALERAGATFEKEENGKPTSDPITKTDLFRKGLSGGEGSRERRLALIHVLDLPEHLSANALLDILNALMTREEFLALNPEDPADRAAE
jgi:ribonuclease M5